MKFGHGNCGQCLAWRGKARKAQYCVAIIGSNNQNAAHRVKACVAHRPWSSKKSFQTRSDIQQEMLGWRRGQPSRLLPFIKSPEAQGIFRLRQSTKASDFFSRQDPILQ
jgi:hypothetical protein